MLSVINDKFEKLTVRAGINGFVQSLPVELGQSVVMGEKIALVGSIDRLYAMLSVSQSDMEFIALNQLIKIDTRNGITTGVVSRINPVVEQGMVAIDVNITGDLPNNSRPELNFDGVISTGTLTNIMYKKNRLTPVQVHTIELHIPPLRERLEDLMPLAQYFVEKHSIRYGGKKLTLAADVEYKLKSYAWPGNIRGLSHMIERAVLLSKSEEIRADDIVIKGMSTATVTEKNCGAIAFMTLDKAEQQLLHQALNKTAGSAIEAAELLGINKSAIYRRMEKYDIKS